MKYAYTLTLAATLALTACGSLPPGQLRPIPDSPDPILDVKTTPTEKLGTYATDKKECRLLQENAMPFNLLRELGTNNVEAFERAKEQKASEIMRRCLGNRGYAVY